MRNVDDKATNTQRNFINCIIINVGNKYAAKHISRRLKRIIAE